MLLKLGPGTQQLPELGRGKREESPTLGQPMVQHHIPMQKQKVRHLYFHRGDLHLIPLKRTAKKQGTELHPGRRKQAHPQAFLLRHIPGGSPSYSTQGNHQPRPQSQGTTGRETKKHQLWSRDTQHAQKVTQPRAEGAHGQQLHSQSITGNAEQCKWPRGEHSPELQNPGQQLQSRSRARCLQLELFPLHLYQS